MRYRPTQLALACFIIYCISEASSSSVKGKLQFISHKASGIFKKWAIKHHKIYKSEGEKLERFNIFIQNYEQVEMHNKKNHGWKKELNVFSDMSDEEFKQKMLMQAQNCSATKGNHKMTYKTNPVSFDWRKKGNYVTPVKNQGHCGSCWTFSTTGCLESATAIHQHDHPLYELSEQQLVDCAQAFDNHGCNGGLPSHAFEYLKYNGGLEQEKDYPYMAKNEHCNYTASLAKAQVKGVVNITQDDEAAILDAVANMNPVSIAFQVLPGFRDYKGGVYSNPECTKSPSEVNHAVLVVGYGVSEDGKDYWIIKNSWGPDWGLNGYFYMKRGVNMCGIATCASYPIVPEK